MVLHSDVLQLSTRHLQLHLPLTYLFLLPVNPRKEFTQQSIWASFFTLILGYLHIHFSDNFEPLRCLSFAHHLMCGRIDNKAVNISKRIKTLVLTEVAISFVKCW
jgi:hypothetical protein